MIRLDFPNLQTLEDLHYNAVLDYVAHAMRSADIDEVYDNIRHLSVGNTFPQARDGNDFCWLRQFILADVDTLKDFINNSPKYLKFRQFKKLYLNRFSRSPETFVDSAGTYNAYTLFDAMDIKVCPYCENEFLVGIDSGGRKRRLMEFDHFYPKGDNEYPALAICFFNLIPSCLSCNRTKMTNALSANPYDPSIESQTSIYPDIMSSIGINYETVTDGQCEVSFHATGDMVANEATLSLEQRYRPPLP